MNDLGKELDKVKLTDLGTAKRVVVTNDTTTLFDGAGKKTDVDARVAQIRAEVETTTSDYDKEKLKEGLHATRAAVEEGILPGGGFALLRAREVLKKVKRRDDEDFDVGLDILYEALARPA